MAQTSRSADLTSGPMLQKIILFSIPLAASSILQLLFNAADVVVVGRFAGSTARWAAMPCTGAWGHCRRPAAATARKSVSRAAAPALSFS